MSDTERVWPVAVDGVYPDDGAETIRMGEPDVEPNVEIRVLQVGSEEWVAAVRFSGGGCDYNDEMIAGRLSPTRTGAICAAVDEGLAELWWLGRERGNNPEVWEMTLWLEAQSEAYVSRRAQEAEQSAPEKERVA